MEIDKYLLKFNKEDLEQKSLKVKDESFEKLMFIYSSAIKELEVKINNMKEQFSYFYNYNLISNVTSRIKKPNSIIKK